jgi:hypothetical protein
VLPARKRAVRAAGRVRVHCGGLTRDQQGGVCCEVFEKMMNGRKAYPEGDAKAREGKNKREKMFGVYGI